ncbi:MAG TPA: ArsC/Spx/MgsR family protein [Longimicrobium sp.]|jgi:arsenate reductase|uniref:arsenate reductase family protein n=1 Tax=Longimicrobium sp. TaxID=2029185 RepID=UPI002ED9199E
MNEAEGVDVYWLPHCSTCQKAVEHLRSKGVVIRSLRDLKAQPLEHAEVEDLARKAGGADALFSRRAMKYRKMGLHEQQLSEDDLLRHMTEEYTFITRPVVVRGDRATAGFSAKRLDDLVR